MIFFRPRLKTRGSSSVFFTKIHRSESTATSGAATLSGVSSVCYRRTGGTATALLDTVQCSDTCAPDLTRISQLASHRGVI